MVVKIGGLLAGFTNPANGAERFDAARIITKPSTLEAGLANAQLLHQQAR